MDLKQQIHSLVDTLPEGELQAARRFLEFLQTGCDEPLTAEEAAESDAAWRDYLEGKDPGMPLDRARRELS